uniref:A1-antitrypsin n=1 Tax=Monopterus albus TaxID=43700 RepID=A0A1Q1N9E0_MONAL|nr:a1-antitrypsin [Monopterus albus]ATG84425.1 a1-antitrypsin variant 2 [Monopterus albus]
MRGVFASCALAALLLAVAWADHNHHGHNHDSEHSHEDGVGCQQLASPNADFAFALYKSLKAKTAAGKNIFYSPLGISTALSMLSTGAHGETHSQLFSSLGYSTLNQTQVNEGYKYLMHVLGHNEQLNVGNAVALHSDFSPLETFRNDVKRYYSGEIFTFNATEPDEAVAEINTYIANKTQGKTRDMVQSLGPDLAMVIINYVYFKAQWEKPFDSSKTQKEDFHVDEHTTVQVDMMYRMGRYDFYQDQENHTSILLLPYKGNTSMMIVLPDEGKMQEVEDFISKEHIKHWHDKLFKHLVDVFLPKFSISTKACLGDTLKELGITDAFTAAANFCGMSDDVKLQVSKVSHQAVLSVDETGTEAAGVTTIELMPVMMPSSIKLNRPFLVLILWHSAKSILFMGKINNPTAK